MALGYAFGQVLTLDRQTRVRLTAAVGLGAILAFALLRASALYGDPEPFQAQDTPAETVMAFLNCEKYPPSLLYALMTLGPGLLMLAALDATEGAIATPRPARQRPAPGSRHAGPRAAVLLRPSVAGDSRDGERGEDAGRTTRPLVFRAVRVLPRIQL